MRNAEEVANETINPTQENKLRNLPVVTWEEVEKSFTDLLHLDDLSAIRVTVAAMVANRFDNADPVWLLIVAPSASAKTEFVNCLAKVPGTHLLSSVTPNTFLSGWSTGKRDPSLLLRLGNRFVILQKDFTTVLSLRQESRGEILAQLREIYDGVFVREFGTGQTKRWEGKAGFISGVTLEVETTIMTGSRLGDRFLYYRLPPIDDRSVMRKANQNHFRGTELREKIQHDVAAFMEHLTIPTTLPDLPEKVKDAVMSLCSFVVRARAPVIREMNSTRDIIDIPVHEGPARFYKEIISMCHAFSVMGGGEANIERDWPTIAKLALDAVPNRRIKVINYLYACEWFKKTPEIAVHLHLPTRTTHHILDELECCGVVIRKDKGTDSNAVDEWRMDSGMRHLLSFRESPEGRTFEEPKEPPQVALPIGDPFREKTSVDDISF